MENVNSSSKAPRAPSLKPEDFIKILKENKPQLRQNFDALSILLHCMMKEMGFRFIGCGDSNDVTISGQFVPPDWNKSNDSFCFRYKHPQSSMTFVIKSLVLGDKLLVHGIAEEDKNIRSVELSVNDYVKSKVSYEDFDNLYKNVEQLLSTYKETIVSKLFPMSITEAPETTTVRETPTSTTRSPDNDPLRIPGTGNRVPPNPYPYAADPYFDEDYGTTPPGWFGIGSHDLNPFPSPYGTPFGGPGSGSQIGPHHPGFGPGVRNPYNQPHYGRGRGRGFAPPPPPGARFDPYGPPGFPGSGNPDNDDLPPPGYGNMYL